MPQATFTADFEQFQRSMAEATAAVNAFASTTTKSANQIASMSDALDKVSSKTKQTTEQLKGGPALLRNFGNEFLNLKGIAASFAAAFTLEKVVSGLASMVGQVIELGGALTDMSAKTGLSTDQLQGLKYAAEQNGNTLEQVTGTIATMNRIIGVGDDSTVAAVERLGLSFSQLRAMDTYDRFIAISGALREVKSDTERAALGAMVLGRGFAEVLPTITQDLAGLVAEAERLGLVIDTDTVKALDDLGDSIDRVQSAGLALIAKVLQPFLPHLNNASAAALSLSSNLGMLFDAIQGGFALGGPMGAGAAAGIVGGIEAAGDMIVGTLPKVKELENSFESYRRKALEQIPDQTKQAAEAFALLTTETKKTADEWKRGEAAAKAHAAELKKLAEAAEKLSGVGALKGAAELAKLVASIGGAAKIAAPEVEGVRKTMEEAIRIAEARGDMVPDQWRDIAFQTGQATSKINEYLQSFSRLPPLIEDTSAAMRDLELSRLTEGLPEVVEGLPDLLKGGFGRVEQGDLGPPKKFWETAFGTPQQIGQLFSSTMTQALAGGGNIGKSVGSALGGNIAGGLAKTFAPQLASMFGKTLGGVIGGAAGPIGAIVGSLAGGLVDKLFGPSEREKTKKARDEWVASAGGLEQIEAAAKRANVSLDKLMSASKQKTLNAEIQKFSAAVAEADKRIQSTAKSFADLSKAGGLVSQNLVKALKVDIDQPEIIATLQAFFSDETARAVSGLGAMLEGSMLHTAAGADAAAASLSALFTSMQAQGVPAAQALATLSPVIAQFQTRLTEMGATTAPAAFQQLQSLAAIAGGELSGPLIASVQGVGEALTGLFNTGLLTQEMFSGLAGEAAATFHELEAQGKGGQDAILLMQKPLQTIWELQQKFGFQTDESTQGVIDFAYNAGLIGEKFLPATERMAQGIEKLVTKLDEFLSHMLTGVSETANQAAGSIVDTFGRIKIPEIKVPVSVQYDDSALDRIPGSVSVSPSSSRGDLDLQPITVTTVLDGQVIAQNQMPHLARELTLVGA